MSEQNRNMYGSRPSWSAHPLNYFWRHTLLRQKVPDIRTVADESWEIAPGEESVSLPAYFLPGQFDRVTGSMYTGDVRTEMCGGVTASEAPVRAYLVKDAILQDGAVFKDAACTWLGPRKQKAVGFRIDNEITRASSYSSYNGNVFFGMWLLDDCATYRLAEKDGTPINTNALASRHALEYENWLGMKPVRLGNAYIRELVLYDDLHQTRNKRERCRENARRLLSKVEWTSHPGVFIMRRATGARRILENEQELADYLSARRGFRIVDITTMSVPQIIAACAGARAIVGVEGSHLIHGIMVLDQGASVLTLMPPDRFCSCIKRVADPDGQHFGFVVGKKAGEGFLIDPEEVERTLDLMPL